MRMMKTLWLPGAAVLALGLSGCGGGSDTKPPPAGAKTPVVEVEEVASVLLSGDVAESVATALGAVVIGAANVNTATNTAADSNSFTVGTAGTSPNILVRVTRTGEEPMVTVTHTGDDGNIAAPGATDSDDTSLMMTDRKPPAAGHLHTARFADEDKSHYANVYTDILPPGPEPFDDFHPLDVHTDADDEVPFEALRFVPATHASLVTSDELPMPGDTRTYPVDDVDTEAMDEAGSFDGMLQGATGTFRCNGANACTVQNDAGTLTFGGDWIFIPADMAMAMVKDDDFLTFGYWTERPAEADAAWTFTPFSTGSMPYGGDQDTVDNVEGSARYDGSAAGGYVRRQYDPNGVEKPDSAEAGAFTAAVTLTAYFGGNNVVANNQWTIRGAVSNFVNADGGSLDKWTVTLDPADFSGRTESDWPDTESEPRQQHCG